MKVAIIDNPELVEIVQSGLKRNKELYGKSRTYWREYMFLSRV